MPISHYFPGVYTINLLDYTWPTHLAVYHLTFPICQGTIGTLINKVMELNMHHFLFLPSTADGCWKGCGDHLYVLSIWFQRWFWCCTCTNSIKNPDKSLCEEPTFTYIEGSCKTWEQVGHGWWVVHDPEEDDLMLETTFTDHHLTYLLTTKTSNQD